MSLMAHSWPSFYLLGHRQLTEAIYAAQAFAILMSMCGFPRTQVSPLRAICHMIFRDCPEKELSEFGLHDISNTHKELFIQCWMKPQSWVQVLECTRMEGWTCDFDFFWIFVSPCYGFRASRSPPPSPPPPFASFPPSPNL